MLDHECLLLVPLPTDCGGAYSTTMGNYFSTYESAFVRSLHCKKFCDALDSLSSLPDHSRASMAFLRKTQTSEENTYMS